MATTKQLTITNNVTEGVQINAKSCAIMVTTAAAADITVSRSVDGTNFAAIADVVWAVNGTDVINLTDIIKGQYLKVSASAEMTLCKILF